MSYQGEALCPHVAVVAGKLIWAFMIAMDIPFVVMDALEQ